MAKKKKYRISCLWIILPVATTALFIAYSLIENKATQQFSSDYLVYEDPTYNFRVEYPEAWEVRNNTQVFENGDAIAFGISGPTQKKNTELTDGAQVAIAKPFTINTTLSTWIKEYFPPQATVSTMTLTQQPYESVEQCSRVGCMTYYYTVVNNQVYGVAVFAQGANKDKMVYENTTLYMLKSLKFNSDKNAVMMVKALPEVKDYLKRVPNGLVEINGEEDDAYLVQVYEVINGHTATFNWYTVNKTTGEIKKEF